MTHAVDPIRHAPRRVPRSAALLGALFVGAGVLHFVAPRPYERIIPAWLPNPPLLVALSGAAEILGGVGVLIPATRPAAGMGLIALLVAVFPANVEMLRVARATGASAGWQTALWLRLPLQGALIWWCWRVARSRRRP